MTAPVMVYPTTYQVTVIHLDGSEEVFNSLRGVDYVDGIYRLDLMTDPSRSITVSFHVKNVRSVKRETIWHD